MPRCQGWRHPYADRPAWRLRVRPAPRPAIPPAGQTAPKTRFGPSEPWGRNRAAFAERNGAIAFARQASIVAAELDIGRHLLWRGLQHRIEFRRGPGVTEPETRGVQQQQALPASGSGRDPLTIRSKSAKCSSGSATLGIADSEITVAQNRQAENRVVGSSGFIACGRRDRE